MSWKLRSVIFAAAISALSTPMAANATPVAAPPTFETFTFTGDCSDCAGTGIGTLKLENYTPGNTLTTGNFVSFEYHSNLITEAFSNASFLNGQLGPTFPAAQSVSIFDPLQKFEFFSGTDGFWCTGPRCANDIGSSSSWAATATPLPAALPLFAGGLGVVGFFARRRKRKNATA
jgi:hypothetical protein